MLEKLNLWKVSVWSVYLCAQILVFAALLLTSTNMIIHIISMLFSIGFYFGVGFKNAGVYKAEQVANLDDAIEKTAITEAKKIDIKDFSQEIHDKTEESQKIKKLTQNDLNENSQQINIRKQNKKKTSLDNLADPEYQLQQESKKEESQKQVKKDSEQNLTSYNRASNFISAAKTIFGNITNIISRKDLGSPNEKKQSEKSDSVSDNDKNQKSIRPKPVQNEQLDKYKSEELPQEHKQEKAQKINNNKHATSSKKIGQKIIKSKFMKKMQQIRRYCRICQVYQPLRVRHCHECQQCITTFDHHCPWIANCIGEKNKHIFLGYLFCQNLQFLIIVVDLIRYLAHPFEQSNKGQVAVLMVVIIIFLGLLSSLLGYQIYLIMNNLTTWESLRWNKIQYLTIFDRSKIISLFTKGTKQNIKNFWKVSRSLERKIWENEIKQQHSQYLIKKSSIIVKRGQKDEIQTSRRLNKDFDCKN